MAKYVTIGNTKPLQYTGYDRLKNILKNDIYGELTNINFFREIKYEGQKLKLGIFARLSPQIAKKKNKKLELTNTYDPRRNYIIGFYPENILEFIERTGKGIDSVAYIVSEFIDIKNTRYTLHLYDKSNIKGSWMHKKYMEYLGKLAISPITKVNDILNNQDDKIHTFRVYQNVIDLNIFNFSKMYAEMSKKNFKKLFEFLHRQDEMDVDGLTEYLYSFIPKSPLIFNTCKVYGGNPDDKITMELRSSLTKIIVQYGKTGGYSLELESTSYLDEQNGSSFLNQIDEILESNLKRKVASTFPKIRKTALQDIFYDIKNNSRLTVIPNKIYYKPLDLYVDNIEHVQNIVNAIYQI